MKRRILAATPMIALFLFLLSGLYLKNWRLGWTFFLLIPISTILLTGNFKRRISEVIPLVSLTLFLILGFGYDLWNPGWMVFLLIPLVNFIYDGRLEPRKLVSFTVTMAFIGIGLGTGSWHPTWIIFLLIPIINTIFFPQRNGWSKYSEEIKRKYRTIISVEPNEDKEEDK
ncbi:MAG: hypothetical protein RBT45_00870 [Acholeplasmataceae bacterium]|jgi:hypothetical protein|nr:hypothetical protein [Acholeplasmataceae bacterium]